MPTLNYDQQTRTVAADTPADAQGMQVSGAVGQALEGLGHEGTQLSSDMQRINYQRQEADGISKLQDNIFQAHVDFSNYMEQQKSKVPPNGEGYVDSFFKTYDDWKGQLIDQQTTPRLKRMAAEQARTVGLTFFNQAKSWQAETNRAYRYNNFDNSLNTGSTSAGDEPGPVRRPEEDHDRQHQCGRRLAPG